MSLSKCFIIHARTATPAHFSNRLLPRRRGAISISSRGSGAPAAPAAPGPRPGPTAGSGDEPNGDRHSRTSDAPIVYRSFTDLDRNRGIVYRSFTDYGDILRTY
jgi:hypothetical protein